MVSYQYLILATNKIIFGKYFFVNNLCKIIKCVSMKIYY